MERLPRARGHHRPLEPADHFFLGEEVRGPRHQRVVVEFSERDVVGLKELAYLVAAVIRPRLDPRWESRPPVGFPGVVQILIPREERRAQCPAASPAAGWIEMF